ncbi:MAG: hypothetical protein GEU83_06850 [Pseudonocardiaceae bacterium]|nr:hypothetical protein [Pseudonocardiaceae bacterium]
MTMTRPLHAPRRPHTLGVIGAGRVGRAVTAAVVTAGLVSTVLVYSRRRVEADALATDATDLAATQHLPTTIAAVGHPRELLGCSVIVVSLRARFDNPDRCRATGLAANAPLVTDLAHQLRDHHGTVVMVTNPVDLMTRLWADHNIAPLFGIGSNLDSARYRALVAGHARVDVGVVTGSVLGEHGPGAIRCTNATRVHGKTIELPWPQLREQLHAPRITRRRPRGWPADSTPTPTASGASWSMANPSSNSPDTRYTSPTSAPRYTPPTHRAGDRTEDGRRHVTLTAADTTGLCLAAARLARELIRVQLEAAGWAILHASAAVRDGAAVITLGPKAAGKTTTALLLTRAGWQLLANDRVFCHPSTLALLPWPSAAALGIGLLHAHGLLTGVRERLDAGHQLHPTVDPAVVDAVLAGCTAPLVDDAGKELDPVLPRPAHRLARTTAGPPRPRDQAAVSPHRPHRRARARTHHPGAGRHRPLRRRHRRPLPRLPRSGHHHPSPAAPGLGADHRTGLVAAHPPSRSHPRRHGQPRTPPSARHRCVAPRGQLLRPRRHRGGSGGCEAWHGSSVGRPTCSAPPCATTPRGWLIALSVPARDQLVPLAEALDARSGSDARDLASAARKVVAAKG